MRTFTGVALLAGALLLVGAPRASVPANLTLDPGFEQDCSGVPCGWAPASSGATLSRDSVSPHSGSASLRLVLTSTAVEARSACIANASGGVYDVSFWYRTANSGFVASGRFNFYSTGDCSGSIAAQVLAQAGASADNAWHQLSASGEAAAGTHSFRVGLTFSCGACGGSPSMNFDDVSVVNTGLALDPGFEQDCSGVPCGWAAASSGATLSRDLVSPHSGSASLRLVLTSTAVEARSACIANASGGVYDASFWYRTASAGVGLASGRFNFYSTGDCSGSIAAQVLMQAGASADNSWHQLSASGEAAAGTHSFRVGLTFSCGACAGSPSVNFDDVAFALPAPPTAAKLRSFQARPRKARAVSCSGRA